MSDNWIRIIPEAPDFVPDAERQERAVSYLRSIAPAADDVAVSMTDHLAFIDRGGNFESIACPSCGVVLDYVHLNPVRARLRGADEPLRRYVWSSFPAYLQAPSKRPPWQRVERLLGERGIPKDSVAGRREFERQMEARRAQEAELDFKPIRRGWCFREETFRKELLAQMAE